MPSAAARSSVSCLEPAIVSAGSEAMAATAPRAAIARAPRAQRLERALAAAHRDVAGPERLDDRRRRRRRRPCADRAGRRAPRPRACACRWRPPRRRRWRRARRAGAAGARSRGRLACPRRARARARALRSHVPPVLQAAPRHGADPVERQALEAVEAPARAAGREVRLAHEPVDVVDLAVAQVVARVEADVERDARDVAGMVEPVRPARRDEAGAAGIELQGALLGVLR